MGLIARSVDYITTSENAIPEQKSSVLFIVDTTFPSEELKLVTEALKQVRLFTLFEI